MEFEFSLSMNMKIGQNNSSTQNPNNPPIIQNSPPEELLPQTIPIPSTVEDSMVTGDLPRSLATSHNTGSRNMGGHMHGGQHMTPYPTHNHPLPPGSAIEGPHRGYEGNPHINGPHGGHIHIRPPPRAYNYNYNPCMYIYIYIYRYGATTNDERRTSHV